MKVVDRVLEITPCSDALVEDCVKLDHFSLVRVHYARFIVSSWSLGARYLNYETDLKGRRKFCSPKISCDAGIGAQLGKKSMRSQEIRSDKRELCKQRQAHQGVNMPEHQKKSRIVCLPLLQIVSEVMIRGHWCTRSLNDQQEFSMVYALLVPLDKLVQQH